VPRVALAVLVGLLAMLARADGDPTLTKHDPVTELMTRDLTGADGKELRMIIVDYAPGGTAPRHRHNAQAFVYVLQGAVRMQIEGSTPVTLGPGETFYEGQDDIHAVSANASQTQPARVLVFVVKDKGAPLSIRIPESLP
jgi:quercetin dioxygenase-like cupin family protein